MKTRTDRFVSLIDAERDSQRVIQGHLGNGCGFALRCIYSKSADALRATLSQPPDLALVSIAMPGGDGIQCIQTLTTALPRLPVVVVVREANLAAFIRAFQAGADGYFVLPGTPESFRETLRNALDGWKPFSKEIQKLLVERLARSSALTDTGLALTPAEQRITAYLVLGYSDKEISTLEGIATGTVHSLTSRIYRKLGTHGRRETVGVWLGLRPGILPAAGP